MTNHPAGTLQCGLRTTVHRPSLSLLCACSAATAGRDADTIQSFRAPFWSRHCVMDLSTFSCGMLPHQRPTYNIEVGADEEYGGVYPSRRPANVDGMILHKAPWLTQALARAPAWYVPLPRALIPSVQ